MQDLLSTIWSYDIVPFVVTFSLLVFVHELGHYLVARRNGVRVETFSIGFGPSLLSWCDSHDTRWKVCAIPLGGYVKMFGEQDGGADEDVPDLTPEEKEVSFHHKRLGQRFAIVAAGPAANFVFAVLLFAGVYTFLGQLVSSEPYAAVGKVVSESAAAEAGFEPGDRIVAIDGNAVTWFSDLQRIVSAAPGKELTFDVDRDGQAVVLTATPRLTEVAGRDGETREIGLLGVAPDRAQTVDEYKRMDPFSALWAGVERTVSLTGQILSALWQMITGQRSADELGGPLRIAQLSGQMSETVYAMIMFTAALSINLGLINLLPIPMLDGGHLAFYTLEALRGRPINQRIQEYAFRFGLAFVVLLMIFATRNDILSDDRLGFLTRFFN